MAKVVIPEVIAEEENLPDLECPQGYHFVKTYYRKTKENRTFVKGHCVKNKEMKK